MKPFLCFLICSRFFLLPYQSHAQKLPDVQDQGVWAVRPLKIDGKPDSSLALKAYNKNTGLYYTLCNDDKNLYLVVKATEAAAINKVMMGGITFTVNTDNKKRTRGARSITFPVISRPLRAAGQENRSRRFGRGMGTTGEDGQRSGTDAITETRRQQLAGMKEIGISGFPDIQDSLISIYNEYSIKAAADYDANGGFVCEMAVPLSRLDIPSSRTEEFMYNVKLNGRQAGSGRPMRADGEGAAMRRGGMEGRFGSAGGGRATFDLTASEPVDFWAKYLLARK